MKKYYTITKKIKDWNHATASEPQVGMKGYTVKYAYNIPEEFLKNHIRLSFAPKQLGYFGRERVEHWIPIDCCELNEE